MVIDCFQYNGEQDILDLRLNILSPHVDMFIIGEAEITFSGKAKPLYFESQAKRFEKFFPKILYSPVKSFYNKGILESMKLQFDLENTSYPFLMAFYQKEHLQRAMINLKDTDTVYYGDVDEIWTPQEVQEEPQKLEQLAYSFHLNQRTTEPWKGTAIATYATVKKYGLNQIREKTKTFLPNGGWHFSNMGGINEVRRKLDSYDHQEVNTEENHQKLQERYEKGLDFLGRGFTSTIDESGWPQYLKDNREKYAHLCK